MTKFKDLIRAINQDKPVTVRHESWLEKNADPKYSAEAIAFAAAELASSENSNNNSKTQMFRASGMNSCMRQRIFHRSGMEQQNPPNARTANIFHTGNFIHLKWQMAGMTEGWLVEPEVEMECADLQLRGHTDGVLYDDSLLEIKSINSRGFDKVYKDGIKEDHKMQATSYLYMQDKKFISFIYENKDNQEWYEIRYERNSKDEDEMLKQMKMLVNYWQEDKLPKILSSCERQEGTNYNYCPFKKSCLELHQIEDKGFTHG
jgi:hypothetical protein